MVYSHEVEHMCVVKKGPNHGPAPIPEEGKWIQAKEIKDIHPDLYKGFHDKGAIHFFNLRLSDITSDLERMFGVKLVLLDEKLAETRYFAWFSNNETLDQILDGINVDSKMKFNRQDDVIYISKK